MADGDIINLPYYGGAKGQTLQIHHKSDGTVVTEIIRDPVVVAPPEKEHNENEKDKAIGVDSFQHNIRVIQQAASELVNLQVDVKKSGRLTPAGQKLYAENLEKLGVSAQKLALLQKETGQEDFKLLFSEVNGPHIKDSIKNTLNKAEKLEANKKPPQDESEPNKENEDENDDDDDNDEENVGEESDGSPASSGSSSGGDTVEVNTPDDEASIAEAKPIGLAIAGVGGVASSKPVATAIVGAGGLAIANPVATAIAGLSPEEIEDLDLPIRLRGKPSANHQNLPMKGKYGLAESSVETLLVGPKYLSESRISDSEIQAELETKVSLLNQPTTIPTTPTTKKVQKKPIHDELNLAIAPDTILPNQYPLYPPNYNPLYDSRIQWSPEQMPHSIPGYDQIPFDQSFQQDRSANPISQGYDVPYVPDQGYAQQAEYHPHPHILPFPQFNPYNVYIY